MRETAKRHVADHRDRIEAMLAVRPVVTGGEERQTPPSIRRTANRYVPR
jgi:hypothetical protein